MPTSDGSDDTEGPDAVPVDNADGADYADDIHQQSRVAASSESKDRCVTQSPLMSTTTDGLLLRENALTSDSSDDTRGPDAAPTDNFHGNILDASQEASDEERCAAATGPTNLSEGDVTTAGSDHLPTCTAAGEPGGVAEVAQQDHSSTPSRDPETRSQGKRQTHLTDSFTRVGSSRRKMPESDAGCGAFCYTASPSNCFGNKQRGRGTEGKAEKGLRAELAAGRSIQRWGGRGE